MMRKQIINRNSKEPASDDHAWLDLERLAKVEITSEETGHPVESALTTGAGPGWLALRIREEGADPEALARQFELFKITEQEKRDKLLRHARLLRLAGTLIAILLFASAFVLLVWVFKQRTR